MHLPTPTDHDSLVQPYKFSEGLASRSVQAARAVSGLLLPRSSSCPQGYTAAQCEKPVSGNTGTLAIVLGAVIPLTCAAVVLFYLHQRIRKKQRAEDSNDAHRSLDFGSEPVPLSKRFGGRKGQTPEMTATDIPGISKHGVRGLSMDMLGSPYLLPPALHGSQESLRSMSRSLKGEHDPYGPVEWARASGETMRSPQIRPDNGSSYSASTFNTLPNEHANLVAHARPMSQSVPPSKLSEDHPLRQTSTLSIGAPAHPLEPVYTEEREADHANDVPLPPIPPIPDDESARLPPPRTSSARKDDVNITINTSDRPLSDASYYEDDVEVDTQYNANHQLVPQIAEPMHDGYDIDPSMIHTGRFSIDTPSPSLQYPAPPPEPENRMSYMGLRPLPPDHPEENAEQRANRIRSFYREYFDDSKPNPSGQYEEDWDADYMAAAEWNQYYDASIQKPFAQPMGRRAMTPPPGGARFAPGPHARHFSTASGSRGIGRPGMSPVQKPKKKLPPPKPLTSLPTPHLLREDTMVLGSIDFAPPSTFRDAQNGRRPDSPMGIQRPFSPSVRVYSPLVPATDELSVMPSPHHLRKSGTFTNLDFARLPRFRGQEGTASDAGSIRSARSGISAMQVDAVRAGAYRVSRIPKEFVTTRDDLHEQLKPRMNLVTPS